MKTNRTPALAVVTALIATTVAAQAQYTYITLDHPLAIRATLAYAISASNVVGVYRGTNLFNHGFIYNGSTWSTLDEPLTAPGSGIGTFPRGIWTTNIVGYYSDTNNHIHGFRYSGSTWSTLDDPLGVNGTFPLGISGTNIVGSYYDSSNNVHGFLYDGSTWTTLDDPLTGFSPYRGSAAAGIS